MLPVKNKRRVQPKAYVEVNKTGIAKDLVLAVNLQNGIMRNAVTGEIATLAGTAATPASGSGLHGKLFAGGIYSFANITGIASANPCTILVVQNLRNTTQTWQCAVSINSNFALYLPGNGNREIATYASGTVEQYLSATNSLIPNINQTVVFRKTASITESYIDGVVQSLTGTPVGTWSAPLTVGIGAAGNLYETSKNEIDLVLIWKRALTPLEIKSISNNPWQVFKPYHTFIPSLSSSTSSVEGIGSSIQSQEERAVATVSSITVNGVGKSEQAQSTKATSTVYSIGVYGVGKSNQQQIAIFEPN